MNKYFIGIGRRKNAIAQVRISKGSGKNEVIGRKSDPDILTDGIGIIEKLTGGKSVDISIIVKGGGISSQSEAIRLGFARAISKLDPDNEKVLKKEGLLTRDPRKKERKKPGLKRARRAPQWQKR